jgi:hypothetical protein
MAPGILSCEQLITGPLTYSVLGENIFYKTGLGQILESFQDVAGTQIFGHPF